MCERDKMYVNVHKLYLDSNCFETFDVLFNKSKLRFH